MFGTRLKELRTAHGYTLRQLGKELDISYSSLSNYENGVQQPNYETLEKIATFFNVRLDYLTGKSDIPSFNGLAFNDDIKSIQESYNNAPLMIQEKLSLILDNLYLICNELMRSPNSTQCMEVFQNIMNNLLSIQIIAQKSSFVGSAMPDLSDIENAYKNYQSEKNNLVSNLDLFFESVKKH
ncbi:helix-turn-helix transcriptional regulator [Enterocloster citroniae]|uniref:helix-turn-helix domain-containing protein n=1 Tax=Enterocloster citroniae TaxID=358743 RepID=UPI0032C12A32